jgi:hypothetical protein
MLNRFELAMLALWLGAAWCLGRTPGPRFAGLTRAWRRLAHQRRVAVVLVGCLGGALSAVVALVIAWPQPRVHDEFSYLLGADTFAHGRLTNPTHPMWVFFETFHVSHQPTYHSIYPPGQALFLALGEVLGHPLAGVWISFGLACAAVCWMLQAWLPPRWALLGGILAAVRVGFLGGWAGVQGYWSQSYWGGAVAMLGGALVFGALRRLWSRPRASQAMILGLGLVILANSRPFEGLVVSLPAGVVLLTWLLGQNGPSWRIGLGRVVLPVVLILGLAGGAMAYYNTRLTGKAWVLPYQMNGAAYAVTPLFRWQPLGPEPVYRHAVIRAYHLDWAREKYWELQTLAGFTQDVGRRFEALFHFYVGVVLMVPLLTLSWILRDRWMRFAALTCGLLVGAGLATLWLQPHYAAPATCLVFVLVVQGLRHLRLARWHGRPVGRFLVRTMPVIYLALFAFALVLASRSDDSAWYARRARLQAQLEADGRSYLVLVRYDAGHSPLDEWVYNQADIDNAKVVWARDMGQLRNRPLLDYFRGRQVWLLDADEPDASEQPYRPDS